jgi:hypothetical protein
LNVVVPSLSHYKKALFDLTRKHFQSLYINVQSSNLHSKWRATPLGYLPKQ